MPNDKNFADSIERFVDEAEQYSKGMVSRLGDRLVIKFADDVAKNEFLAKEGELKYLFEDIGIETSYKMLYVKKAKVASVPTQDIEYCGSYTSHEGEISIRFNLSSG